MLAGGAGVASLFTDAPHPPVRALLASAAALALLFRQTRPVPGCVWAGCLLVVESVTTEAPDEAALLFSITLLAYSVCAHEPLRRAWVGSAALATGCVAAVSLDPSDSASNILPTVLLFVVVPGGLGWGVHRRTSRITALEIETAALAAEAESAVEGERRRIARELHDVVSHAVTLIAVQAEAGQAVIGHDPAAAERSLAAIGVASREALAELDRMLGLLRDHGATTEGPASTRRASTGSRLS